MDAKGFILILLVVVAAGAGAGYGVARIAPTPDEQEEPATAALVAPGAPDASAQGGGENVDVDDLLAAMPEDARRELENDPERAAQVRAQLQQAIDSGDLPPGLAPGTGTAGGARAAGGTGNDAQALGDVGARNATPLTGTVASFDGAALRLDTEDGPVDVAVGPDATVTITRQASDAADALTVDAGVTVIAQEDEAGGQTAVAILVGDAGAGGRRAALGAALGGAAVAIAGTVVSYADGVLSVQTEDGLQSVNVPPETIVRITTTASEAADEFAEGANLTVLVQRAADGSFEAVTVTVGDAGGFGGRGFGGLPRGQRGAGQGSGQQAP